MWRKLAPRRQIAVGATLQRELSTLLITSPVVTHPFFESFFDPSIGRLAVSHSIPWKRDTVGGMKTAGQRRRTGGLRIIKNVASTNVSCCLLIRYARKS
jgi:hypothetical protein